MLALALHKGWSIEGYERRDHCVQQSMLNQVALWAGLRPSQIDVAVDGCGAAVFGLPLDRMARAYARLGIASARGEDIPARVTRAMAAHPFLVGGTERLDSIIIEETNGRVLTKVGAEGVHSGVILGSGVGFAIKVEDGNSRAQQPALIQLLVELGALPQPLPATLAELLRRPVRNSRGEVVGETYVKIAKRRSGPALAASN
jgi:L-asparaginase II